MLGIGNLVARLSWGQAIACNTQSFSVANNYIAEPLISLNQPASNFHSYSFPVFIRCLFFLPVYSLAHFSLYSASNQHPFFGSNSNSSHLHYVLPFTYYGSTQLLGLSFTLVWGSISSTINLYLLHYMQTIPEK